jgi:hypothetical protein
MDFLTTWRMELLGRIAKEKTLSDSLKAELKTAMAAFEQTWKGTSVR